ncbi:hypothetical protein Tco_0981542 [Tanacetum coccineum]
MLSKLRLRYEYENMTREKFQKKVADNCVVVQQRDAKIVALKTRLEKAEREAAEVVALRGHVSELEAKMAHGELNRHIIKPRADCERLRNKAEELDAHIADVRRDMDNDLYPHMLTAIVISMAINKGIQQGLEARVVHGKVGRSLPQIEAYDPKIEAKYVAAVFEFENASFPLLDELEGLKDSPLAHIMSTLTLKDDHGDTNVTLEFF